MRPKPRTAQDEIATATGHPRRGAGQTVFDRHPNEARHHRADASELALPRAALARGPVLKKGKKMESFLIKKR